MTIYSAFLKVFVKIVHNPDSTSCLYKATSLWNSRNTINLFDIRINHDLSLMHVYIEYYCEIFIICYALILVDTICHLNHKLKRRIKISIEDCIISDGVKYSGIQKLWVSNVKAFD